MVTSPLDSVAQPLAFPIPDLDESSDPRSLHPLAASSDQLESSDPMPGKGHHPAPLILENGLVMRGKICFRLPS